MHIDDTHSQMWVGLDSRAKLGALIIQIFAGIQTAQPPNMSWLTVHICRGTARKCGPVGPSRELGPAWADHKSSWAVPQEDIPEDEPDVLC